MHRVGALRRREVLLPNFWDNDVEPLLAEVPKQNDVRRIADAAQLTRRQ